MTDPQDAVSSLLCAALSDERSDEKGTSVKLLATLGLVVGVLAGTSLGSAAATHRTASVRHTLISLPSILERLSHQYSHGALSRSGVSASEFQTGGTPTATPTTSPTPTSTTTPNPAYPDPNTLLSNMLTVFQQVRSVHFDNVIDGEQVATAKLHLDSPGDANCTGPSMAGNVNAKQSLEGTSQSSSVNERFVQIRNHTWLRSKKTHQKWTLAKKNVVTAFGFQIDNPLVCSVTPVSPGSGSSSSPTDQIKDLTTVGPDTFQGVAVWHIHGIDVVTDSSGQAFEIPFDFYLSQDHYLPYESSQVINDPQNKITLTEKQILTSFGKPVKITNPTKKKAA